MRLISRKAVFFLCCLFSFFELNAQQQILHYKEKNLKLKLKPDAELSGRIEKKWSEINGSEPLFVAEALYKVEKKSKSSEIEEVSRIARSFSTMQGITYYSNSKKRVEVLYPEAYTVLSATNPVKTADDAEGSADGKTIYAFQHDSSFGPSVYRVEYFQTEDEVAFCSLNLDPLSYGIVKAVQPEKMLVSFVVREHETWFDVYILIQIDMAPIPFADKIVSESIKARLESIYGWFLNSYNAAGVKTGSN